MEEVSPAAAQCHAEFLRRVLKHAHRDSNAALREMAATRQSLPQPAHIQYVVPATPGSAPRTIPAAQFHRQYALCLHSLELTIHGYCIARQFGWERKREMAFSTRRPALWRRLLRHSPLLAFTVTAEAGAARIGIGAARRAVRASRSNLIVRLDPGMQQELAQLNRTQSAAASLKTRLFSWFANWRKRRA